uniref:C-type lectin domain-containing protein n=1 Tax=Cavia porcellus TaxID=10141 RepID=A0A286XQY9_CAVPO
MTEEPTTFTTLNKTSKQKHTRNNDIKNKYNSNALPVIEEEVKQHKHYKKHKATAGDIASKGDSSHLPWKLFSSVLGIKFLLLMGGAITVAVFITNSSPLKTSPTIHQKGPHCQPCPKDWIWFRCSCYYFSVKKLTWSKSRHACMSLNSSLLKTNKEEMNFFHLKSFYWIGMYYKKPENQWLWENNSVLPSDISEWQQACLSYKSKELSMAENCEIKQYYICK